MSDVLLDDDGMIRGSPVSKQTSLGGANYGLEKWLDSINNDLSYNFVTSVAQPNLSKVFSVSCIPALGNEAEKGAVVFSWHVVAAKDFSTEGDCFWSKVIPKPLKEEWMVAIRFLDAIKSSSNSSKIGEDVTKHSMVPMGVLGLKSPDCLLKARILSEVVINQVSKSMNHQSGVMGFDKSFTLAPKARVVSPLSVPDYEIHEVSWNARELSASMQPKNRVAQYEYIEQSIIKMLEEEIVNLIEENLIKELTTEMNKVLKVKEDVAIKMNPYNVNDLTEYTELSIKKLKGESQKQIEENIIEELTTKMNKVLKGKEDVTIETDPYDVNDFAEYTELSIKKLEEEIYNQIEVNIIEELTTKMNEVLKEKEDVTIEKNPYDVNDLAYMKKEKPKQARKVMKVNLGGEGSISNVSQPFIR
ncbi:hypothetical protein CQW23_25624 [Capsicum baccatum]|uniref:Uncharacterized protein n=1 Tax=Capsicum baccatum TaxID=33114 RepID=A0A2G2VLG9_CAPBA|nr:hypothetical protein CQW23_25624 [Capsicum baccatum]